MLTLAAALALATAPLDPAALDRAAVRLEQEQPQARTLPARHGGLQHASGLAVRLLAGGEAGARAFLQERGAPFGVGPGVELERVRVHDAPGADGAAVFRRRVEGLPVFGGELAVGWRGDGAVTLVNGSPALATRRAGAFAIDAAQARAAALRGLPGTPLGEPRAEAGLLERGGWLWPAWKVVHATDQLAGHGTSYVDGVQGALLWRVPRVVELARCTAPPCIAAFLLSPVDPPPPAGQLLDDPLSLPLLGVAASSATLDGDHTAAFNCRGLDVNTVLASVGRCADQTPAAAGGFTAAPALQSRDYADAFAEQSAYFHVDAHARFLEGLDPSFGAGALGFVPAFVNLGQGDGPLDNAFFASGQELVKGKLATGAMAFGQGVDVDYAYDAAVTYHELTHAAVDATASFAPFQDALGVDFDPGSLNEGTADALAVAHAARSLRSEGLPVGTAARFGRYAFLGADAFVRDLSLPYTCRGNGPADGRNPGRIGEVHDDGRIWGSFAWALIEAAAAQEDSAPGALQHMSEGLFRALVASTPGTGFAAYAASVRQKVRDAFCTTSPCQAAEAVPAEEFTACTIAQRDLAGCEERAVPLYSGERAETALRSPGGGSSGPIPGPHQLYVDVPCGATALRLQALSRSGDGTVYLRYGRPVEFLPAAVADWRIDGAHDAVQVGTGEGAATCFGTQTPFGPGRWYLALEGRESAGGLGRNTVTVGVSIEAPPSIALARQPYLFGNAPGDPNRCAWGSGAVPAPLVPPAYATPPSLAGCSPPTAPPGPPAACAATHKSGCGSPGAAGSLSVLLPLWLAARSRRRRRALSGPRPA
jgi:hypothetical protein